MVISPSCDPNLVKKHLCFLLAHEFSKYCLWWGKKIDFQWSLPSWCFSVTHTYYIVLEWSAMSTVWVEHNVNTGILIVNTTPRQQSLSANAPPPSWHITPTLPTSTKIQPKAFFLRMTSRACSFSILSNLLVSSCQHMNDTILPTQSARREMAL